MDLVQNVAIVVVIVSGVTTIVLSPTVLRYLTRRGRKWRAGGRAPAQNPTERRDPRSRVVRPITSTSTVFGPNKRRR